MAAIMRVAAFMGELAFTLTAASSKQCQSADCQGLPEIENSEKIAVGNMLIQTHVKSHESHEFKNNTDAPNYTYSEGAAGQGECAEGWERVVDKEECKAYAKNANWAYAGADCYKMQTVGCLNNTGNIYFSTCNFTETDPVHSPVCRKLAVVSTNAPTAVATDTEPIATNTTPIVNSTTEAQATTVVITSAVEGEDEAKTMLSFQYSDGEANSKIFDGDENTTIAGSGEQHNDVIAIELSAVCSGSSFKVFGKDAENGDTDLRHIRVAYSLDGTSWICYTQSDTNPQEGASLSTADTNCEEGKTMMPSGSVFNINGLAKFVEFAFWGRASITEVKLDSCTTQAEGNATNTTSNATSTNATNASVPSKQCHENYTYGNLTVANTSAQCMSAEWIAGSCGASSKCKNASDCKSGLTNFSAQESCAKQCAAMDWCVGYMHDAANSTCVWFAGHESGATEVGCVLAKQDNASQPTNQSNTTAPQAETQTVQLNWHRRRTGYSRRRHQACDTMGEDYTCPTTVSVPDSETSFNVTRNGSTVCVSSNPDEGWEFNVTVECTKAAAEATPAELLFDVLDTNHDGSVSHEEFSHNFQG